MANDENKVYEFVNWRMYTCTCRDSEDIQSVLVPHICKGEEHQVWGQFTCSGSRYTKQELRRNKDLQTDNIYISCGCIGPLSFRWDLWNSNNVSAFRDHKKLSYHDATIKAHKILEQFWKETKKNCYTNEDVESWMKKKGITFP